MPNQTPNYGLKKPLGTEAYDIGIQNENMDAIDAQMKTNADNISNKADKVPGKGLSTNDFTDAYKMKVDQNALDIDSLEQNKADLISGLIPASQLPNTPFKATTTGTGAAYIASITGLSDLVTGMVIIITPHVVSTTTAPTLNLNGLGAKTIYRRDAKTTARVSGYQAAWLSANLPIMLMYDGTGWIVIGAEKPSAADLNDTVPVNHGGSGKTSWTANRLIYPSSSTAFTQLAFPATTGSFLRQGTSGAPYWSTPAEVLSAIGAAPSGHVTTLINTVNGVHGIRYYNNVLAVNVNNVWIEIKTGGSGEIPPGDPTDISIAPANSSLKIKWTDPTDEVWAGTKLVRKAGSYPSNIDDGVLILDSTTRNAYAETAFVDSGLTNGVIYYYHFFPYSVDGAINVNVDNHGSGVPATYKVYGVCIDQGNNNPASAVIYTDDAVGMTAGSSAWDTANCFADIKPCLLLNGVVQYYLNKSNFAQKADESAATITSESAGDVMIEIPKIGVKITTNGNYVYVKITDNPDATADGFHYYAHTRSSEGDREKLYVGAYLGYVTNSKLYSLSGKTPTANTTIGNFINYATARGTGYDILGFYPLELLQALYLIKYCHLNSQVALGRGYVDASGATATGATNANGMYYGTTSGTTHMKFAGIEDFWGNLRQWIGGLFSDSSRNILTAFRNFNTTGSGYTNRGQGATSDIGNYMSKVQGTTERGFIAKEVSGSATTYYCDGAYLYAGSLPSFGGLYSHGDTAGAFNLYVDYSASTASASLGARLMYL